MDNYDNLKEKISNFIYRMWKLQRILSYRGYIPRICNKGYNLII